jgi:Xaa-Pro aminopeptidase
VKNAHDKGLEKVRSGIACSDIDFAVRSVIDESGYGSFFGHGTGHGVGLDVHEAPRISKRSEMVLETGMVITIEPGIYFPEKWGVRIEDLVLVKQEGCEILSQVPKHLHVI